MRRKNHLLLVLGGLGLVASACVSDADALRDHADEIEKTYGLATAEARVAARDHGQLATADWEGAYQRVAESLGMKRLAGDDVNAFVALASRPPAEREATIAALHDPALLTFLSNLRATFGYEPRFSEVAELLAMSREAGTYAAAFSPGVRDAIQLVRQRAPIARFPLSAVKPAMALGSVPTPRVARTLERFARLEIDLGVTEIQPYALVLLAHTSFDPREADALSTLVRNLPSLQPIRIEPSALAKVAAIPSSALTVMLERLGPTRTWRGFVGFNEAAADWLKELSLRPQAAALVGLLEDASDQFQCRGSKEEAQNLVRIDAAAPEGQAREALVAVFRARAVFDRIDDAATTDFLIALVGDAGLRDAITALHSAFGRWHPTPGELPALRLLASASNLAPVARSVRTLGYEITDRVITKDEATSFAELAKAEAQPLIDGLHIVLPRLQVKGAAALGELAALAKAGVTKDDVLRLDADSISGTLDPMKRARIVEKVKKSG